MDPVDRMQDMEAKILAKRIEEARFMDRGTVSSELCVDCGDPIPEGRRKALKGVRLCVDCAP